MLPMEEPASTLRTVHNRMYPKYQTLGLVQRTLPMKMRDLAERALEVVPLSARALSSQDALSPASHTCSLLGLV